MSSQSTPLILLVPGAFGTPDGYGPLLPYLKEAGFTTQPGPYASSNPAHPSAATCAGDIASLRDGTLRPLIQEEQKDVVILAHSYGAIVASGAAKGLGMKTRCSEGLAGGVIGLIYVAGNIVLENESLREALGGVNPPFIKLDKDMWLEKTKVHCDIVDLKTGHMPFVSQPKALAAEVLKFFKGFVTL